MNGYLLNFYKNSPLRNDILSDETKRNRFKNEFVRNIVWSEFDRLEIREITEFEDFRKADESEKKWVGERQFSMIYDVSDADLNKRLIYDSDTKTAKCRFVFNKVSAEEGEMNNLRFFGVSMVDLTKVAYDTFFSVKNPIKNARRIILNTLDKLIELNSIDTKNICYDIYGSHGGNDLVIIWLTNQFDELVTLIEAIRRSHLQHSESGMIENIYTIMGMRDAENKAISYDDVRGTINIRLTKREGFDLNSFNSEFTKFLNIKKAEFDKTVKTIAGEHDISININANKLVKKIYSANGLIHMGKSIYYKNFIQANTEIAANGDFNNVLTTTIEFQVKTDFKEELINDKEIKEQTEKICSLSILEKTPYIAETLWILYGDYLKNITSTFSYPWTQDLYYQFKTTLESLENIIENNDIKGTKYDNIEFVIKNLRQIILHIAQANRIFFEVPNTHLRHTGTYSKILRAYQGIVKILIKQAYLIPKNNLQSEIIPFVTFDTIPIPKSVRIEVPMPDYKYEAIQLVEIKLPYDALVNIPYYTYLLSHEIYHYIAPSDRGKRNKILTILSLTKIISYVLYKYILNIIEQIRIDEKFSNKKVYKEFLSEINEYIEKVTKYHVMEHFKKFSELIEKYDKNEKYEDYKNHFNETYIEKLNREEIIVLFFTVLTDYDYGNICNKFKNKNDTQIIKDFLNHLQALNLRDDLPEFVYWVNHLFEVDEVSINNECIQRAMREVMADFYMIQTMNMNFNDYIYYIIKSKNLVADENHTDNVQEMRLAIVYNYCFTKKDDRIAKMGGKCWSENCKNLIDKIPQENNKIKITITIKDKDDIKKIILKYNKFLSLYDDILEDYFTLLDFNKYGPLFNNALEKLQEKIVINKEDIFEANVTYVESLQIQDSLSELAININLNSQDVDYNRRCSYEIKITNKEDKGYRTAKNFIELLSYIGKASKEILSSPNVPEEIWYRGHSNSKYKLIPSLYRMKDNKNLFYNNATLRTTMESLFKFFQVKSFNAPEIFNDGNSSKMNIITSMQHYSVPTNILDWSTSVMSAIYFAVEKYMDNIGKANEDKNDCDLWLLNPLRMNDMLKNQLFSHKNSGYPIPAVWGNEEQYKEYFPLSHAERGENADKNPIAMYVAHVNQRIRAQHGTFTMFSLDVDATEKEKGKDFSEYDLQNIQAKIKERNPAQFKQFLARVKISNSAISDIVNYLKITGIKKHIIYPELQNIGQELKNEIHRYLNDN